MRFLFVAALLLGTASCAWQPPPPAAPPPGPVALVQQPPPPTAPPPAATAPVYLPNPLPFLGALLSPLAPHPVPGQMTLSNFNYDTAHVEAMATAYPDCAVRPGMTPADFTLPLNGTRVIAVPPGTDVCWRRELPATAEGNTQGSPAPASPGGWAPWNRAFTSSGHLIDAQL